MARQTITPSQTNRRPGLKLSFFPVTADGIAVTNGASNALIVVKNGGDNSIDVTFVTSYTADGNQLADMVATVAAGEERIFGPFDKRFYNQPNNMIDVNFSGVVDVEAAAFIIGQN